MRNGKLSLIGYTLILLCLCITELYANRVSPPRVFNVELHPVTALVKDIPVTFSLAYELDTLFTHLAGDTGSVTICMIPFRDRADTIMYYSSPVQYGNTFAHSMEFDLIIPDNSVLELKINLACGEARFTYAYYFVSVGEEIQFTDVLINPPLPETHGSELSSRNFPFDKLTAEQKQEMFKFAVDLKEKENRKFVEDLIGPVSESCLYRPDGQSYIIDITLENAYKIAKQGIEIDFVNRPHLEYIKEAGEYIIIRNNDSSSDLDGQLPARFIPQSPSGISIDSVNGLSASGNILTNQPITFYLHLNNTYGESMFALSNGFRVYSPDGATWDGVVVDTLNCGWKTMFNIYAPNYYSCDGIGADTISFGFVAMTSQGLPVNFDEVSWTITIGPIDDAMDGRTICIDSSSFGEAGIWVWIDESGLIKYYPSWSGEECFEIEAQSTIGYTGRLLYIDPVPPVIDSIPIRNVRIEMRDDDVIGSQLLAFDTTDGDGNFSLGPVDNNGDIYGTQDVYFLFYAENECAYVTDDFNDDIYSIVSPVINDIPSGDYDTTIIAPISSHGAFFIADAVYQAHEKWDSVSSIDLDKVQVVSKQAGEGSCYYGQTGEKYIFIEGAISELHAWPDIYDEDAICHEYGHFIEDTCHFFDSSPGGGHHWTSLISDTFAASEGFAHFFANICKDSPINEYYNFDFTSIYWTNSEDGTDGIESVISCSVNDWGKINEGAVAGILWDIFDSDDDDQSTFPPMDSWPNLNDSADGIGDTLSNGYYDIINALLERSIDSHQPKDIDDFWKVWIQPPSFGHQKAIRDIFMEHGIIVCGDVDGNGFVDIGDAVYIINYVFKSGSPPTPIDSGDVNCDFSVNVGDAVYLINYFFRNGTAPCAC